MMENCSSLRSVELEGVQDLEPLLNAVETNPYVKNWIINFKKRNFTYHEKQQLEEAKLYSNDRSVIFYNDGEKLDFIPQSTQLFKISPPSCN